jgi:GT2 family glycosyltransferase
VAVVIATRNRREELLRTLRNLRSLPEQPRVVVVDNASTDGTASAVRSERPDVELIALEENRAAAGRTVGARRVDTPYVAFSDDDSWWTPGSLSRAADLFDRHPRLGLLAARILVGPEEREDPTCVEMANSPIPPDPSLPGPPVLGFLACAAVVRRSAYLEVGGFDPEIFFSGEEALLAADLAAAGWGLSYVESAVTHHHPSKLRDAPARRKMALRNALWLAWLRRPARTAAHQTLRMLGASLRNGEARAALIEALPGAHRALLRRQTVPEHIENDLQRLDRERSLRTLG